MKINRDVVIMRFEYLNKLLKELEDVKNIGNEDFKNNFSTILKTERALVLSTNICIDIVGTASVFTNRFVRATCSKSSFTLR